MTALRSCRCSVAASWAAAVFIALFILVGPRPAAAVDIETVTSPGGITAWLVRDTTNPIVTMRFAFRGGAALDPEGKEGLANMVSGLLDEGAGDIESREFQQKLEDAAIRLSFDTGRDDFTGSLKTLTRNRDIAFELLSLALTAPRFDTEPVERIRAQVRVGIERDLEDPDAVAGRRLFRALFPAHPYGRSVDGSLESVAALTAEDLRAFVKSRFAMDNLVIGVVGDIDADELRRRLDQVFGGLPAKAAPWRLPDVVPADAARTLVFDKDVPQSAILFAAHGLKRDDPDYYAAYVMNHVLGGGSFTSRLYQEVREKRGLVYSVYTQLYPYDWSAIIFGGAGTANKRVSETLSLVAREWRLMGETGVTAEELADAKTYLTGSFPLRFTSSGRIASMLVGIQLADLGIDYLKKRNSLIEAVTLNDIRRVANRVLDPKRLLTVVVGKPEGVVTSN